jgi:hypothetical protein
MLRGGEVDMLRWLVPAIAIGLGTGCVASVNVPFDGDQDGLLDDAEKADGTSPTNPDSDGDGVKDGAEVTAGTSPTDANDYPYISGWKIDSCRNSIEGTGEALGDIAEQFTTADQDGQDLKLYDFCGKTVMLVMGAFW